MWLGHYGSNEQYKHHFSQTPTGKDEEPKVSISGSVWNGSGPVANQSVYLRVIDPPDSSPYVILAGHTSPGDNLDPAAPNGFLEDGAGTRVRGESVLTVTTGDTGGYKALFRGTRQYAGDNYRIEASSDQSFSCSPNCRQSSPITAWKAYYIETNAMWRNSLLLASNAPVNTKEIYVNSIGNFVVGDSVTLIHAPSVFRNQATDFLGFYQETNAVTIARIDPTRKKEERGLGVYKLTLSAPLSRSYFRDGVYFNVAIGDAVVNLTRTSSQSLSAAFQYGVDTRYVSSLFGETAVDVVMLPSNGVGVPLYDLLEPKSVPAIYIQDKWTRSKTKSTREPNHAAVIAASTATPPPSPPNPVGAIRLGTTPDGGGYSYIWVQSIEFATSSASTTPALKGHNASLVAAETVIHELVHQWGVNTATYPAFGGECPATAMSYDDSSKHCLQSSPANDPELDDGHVALHYIGISPRTADSEYLQIRGHKEPK